ncbi:hypothetical protein [Clavibacter michiganensis]|uniref:hypothetical protein n=1 Tax=Clavibacter michiganensis TaxID=28447 RepID=UPI001FB36EAD|nr:hypothetical protein [Clavibacter michiganensis]
MSTTSVTSRASSSRSIGQARPKPGCSSSPPTSSTGTQRSSMLSASATRGANGRMVRAVTVV